MKRDLTRRQFLGAGFAVGSTGAAGCAQPLQMRPRSPEQTEKIAAVKAARADATTRPADLVIDVHCHTFNALDVPIDGFIRSLAQGYGMPPFLDGLLAKITGPFHDALVALTPGDGTAPVQCDGALPSASAAAETAKTKLDTLLGSVPLKSDDLNKLREKIVAVISTAATVAQPREVVAARISCTYPDVELFTPALVDFSYWINRDKHGEVKDPHAGLVDQIKAHTEVSRKSMLGQIGDTKAAFHPYAPFNPRRYIEEGGLDLIPPGPTCLDHAKEAVKLYGFAGVKLYPPCGFLPYGNAGLPDLGPGVGEAWDAALDALYKWCVDEDVPIMTHASMGNAFFPDSSWRASPLGWRLALDRHPNLRVCFGHFGDIVGMDGTADTLSCLAWADGFIELMRKHPNVYADISDSDAGATKKVDRETYQRTYVYWLCERLTGKDGDLLSRRFMYGSDWWMNVYASMDRVFLKNIEDMVNEGMKPYLASKPENAQFPARFWGQNALRFLGILDEDGKLRTKGTAARLTDRYNAVGAKLPRWLGGAA